MDAVFFYVRKYYYVWFFLIGVLIAIYYLQGISIVTENKIEKCYVYYLGRLSLFNINENRLYLSVILAHLEEMIALYFVSFTYFGCVYCNGYLCYKGFCHCIYLLFACKCYGLVGVVVYFATIFPQVLIYAPLVIYTIKKGREKNRKLLYFAVITMITVVGGFVEIYVGYRFFNMIIKLI